VKGIVTLLRDVDLRQRLGRNGRRLVEEKYNWEVAVAKQIQVYIDVLKSKGRFV
jgi:glycosyltransferase involved in cell wall biosynthesis